MRQHKAQTETGLSRLPHRYTGLSANILKEAPDAAVFLALSEQLSRSLAVSSPWFASHVTITLLLSGAIGDACGSVLRLPAEVVCKRLQTGSTARWQHALEDTSFDSWMASWATIVARDVPMGGLQIAAYQEARHAVGQTSAVSDGSFLGDFLPAFAHSLPVSSLDVLAGVLAGAIAGALTTPLDVLVTHVSTASCEEEGSASGGSRSALQLSLDLVKEQGPLTLLRGLGYRTCYYAPLVGCFFGLYAFYACLANAATHPALSADSPIPRSNHDH